MTQFEQYPSDHGLSQDTHYPVILTCNAVTRCNSKQRFQIASLQRRYNNAANIVSLLPSSSSHPDKEDDNKARVVVDEDDEESNEFPADLYERAEAFLNKEELYVDIYCPVKTTTSRLRPIVRLAAINTSSAKNTGEMSDQHKHRNAQGSEAAMPRFLARRLIRAD